MSPRLQMLFDLVRFYSKAETIYTQDSPLIYSFCDEVMESYNEVSLPETTRYIQKLQNNNQQIRITEIGEKSQVNDKSILTVNKIVRSASSSIDKCRLLVAIAQWSNSKTILEVGTNLGVSAMAYGESDFKVDTVEGNNELYQFSIKSLNSFQNITCHYNLFEEYICHDEKNYDLIYIDGDHSYDSTTKLIEKSKALLNENGILIIDDIRWSDGMKKAWQESRSYFNLQIDLFAIGILSHQTLLHYPIHKLLIPKKYKPWPYHFFR